ncbi:MAG TPA: PorP/SprF family type IX secretion system membrane protein [Bacteroidales bacterium]|nr:PorP/SprF family type IX secretion system membrane protein [Bacteroidales bacterium]HPJ59845.1 PorP/SprF family type IX secretion system membrane protein [Bacteroidales bacterium]HPR12707.1 PorP/SprF family type IX secretion system membrane protein [Bacteroidales bacterium]HRW85577.1 PorP/SprF family type IX secretion system membrane protein [Bacteroidales bacterium]
MLKRKIYVLLLAFTISADCFSQDPTFSQFYANQLYLAPSFAGATEEYRLGINYRNQWPAVPGVFHTYSISFDKAMPNFNSGIGVLATYDVAGSGDLSTTNIGLLYSYDFQINREWHIRPGVNFKFYYLGLDIYKLIFNSQLTGSGTVPSIYPPPFETVADVDFATSAVVYNEMMWAGFTLDHLLVPKTSFYGDDATVPIKFNFFGGVQLYKKTRLRTKFREVLSVALNYQTQAKFHQTDVGLYYYRDPLIFGLWYRGIPFLTSQAGDAIIGLVGIKTDQLHIGYSYDFTVSNLIGSTGGAHEISIVYEFTTFSLGTQKRRIRAIPCPEF